MSGPSKINRLVHRMDKRCDWRQRYPPRTKGDRRASVMRNLARCRQGDLGARQHDCDACGTSLVTLNACRDRHCPACARQARFLWYEEVLSWSLNCDYLHIVTTLPHLINPLVIANEADLLRLLFRCTREALLELIRQKYDCIPGLILVVHTWGQRLNFHFHIHVVMTAGGLLIKTDGEPQRWIEIDQDEMEASAGEIARRFKKKYLRGVRKALRSGSLRLPASLADSAELDSLMETLQRKEWVADVGATPEEYRRRGERRMSLGYLGKYVAGTAIGDGRIESIDDQYVTFRAHDYRTGKTEVLTFTHWEFLDAYCDHCLPHRLCRYRTAGIFATAVRDNCLAICRPLLGEPSAMQLAEAADESFIENPFAGEEEEDEGSFVPCPECDKRMRVRLTLEGAMACVLLQVTSAVWALLQSGAELSVHAAIQFVARAQSEQCAVCRALLAGRFEPRDDLIGFVETVIQDRLREQQQRKQQQRGPPFEQVGSEDTWK